LRNRGPLDALAQLISLSGQMKSIAVTELKARCLAQLEDVARTGEPVMVTKRGKPLARIVPSGDK
jgi:prevent-host-death family protein